jgi:hypothetical protein
MLLREIENQLLGNNQQRKRLEEYMCTKLPSLFTKAYNRLLAEQHYETLQASVCDRESEVVYQYGTFARVHEKHP